MLALDWRCWAEGFAWASQVIKDHPKAPVILTTHEIATPTYSDDVFPYQYGNPENDAELSAYGQQVWDNLINDNDQIFLTLNGHYWPPGRPRSATPGATTFTCTSPTTRTATTAARP